MGYESDSSEFEKISTKKLAIMFGLAFVGALFFIQMLQGFPIMDLFRQQVTEEVEVVIKNGDTCIIEGSDGRPREIRKCPYKVGDSVEIVYKERTVPIDSHRLHNEDEG